MPAVHAGVLHPVPPHDPAAARGEARPGGTSVRYEYIPGPGGIITVHIALFETPLDMTVVFANSSPFHSPGPEDGPIALLDTTLYGHMHQTSHPPCHMVQSPC